MYVAKRLQGVLAVQALPRLNRCQHALGKRTEDVFVLDFFNTTDDIKAAFDPFYTATSLSSPTDVNVLHELNDAPDTVGVYDWPEVEAFNQLYFGNAPAEQLSPIIDGCAARFSGELELKAPIGLDASAAELDPQNPNVRGVGSIEAPKDPLDEIIAHFNERWFQGWSATPAPGGSV